MTKSFCMNISLKAKIALFSSISAIIVGACLMPIEIRQMHQRTEDAVATLRENLQEQYDRSAREQVESAMGVLRIVRSREAKGELTGEQARRLAADLLREMKYGTEGYLWVDTYQGVNVVYSGKETEGKSRLDAQDENGVYFIREIIASARKSGGGYTNYHFPKKEGNVQLAKRSYSLAFPDYEWVVGSGNYMEDIEKVVSAKTAELANTTRRQILTQIGIILALTILASALAYFFGQRLSIMIHQISESLISGTNDLRSSIGTILAVSHDLSNISHQQSSAIQQTAAAMEEISSTLRRSADNAKNSEDLSSGSKEKADNGRKMVDRLNGSIHTITSNNDSVAHVIEEGNGKMTAIAEMIKNINAKTAVINDIVFQTKLLSFNASVEAARAGEQGKGFAVVAEEVGKLARISGKAAEEISQLLNESTQEVHKLVEESRATSKQMVDSAKQSIAEGSALAAQCASILNEIVSSSGGVVTAISQIASATNEQSKAVGEISRAVHEIDRTTQIAATSGRTSAEAADGLSDKTKNITKLAFQLESLVKGRKVLPKLQWVNSFSVDVPEMDKEHIELVNKMNTLAEAIERSVPGQRNERLVQAFLSLANFTKQHFEDEERFMKSINFKDFSAHREIHVNLLEKVGGFAPSIMDGSVNAEALMEFLVDWLIHHILNSDKMYGSAYRVSKGKAA